jgi:hypothetical protein
MVTGLTNKKENNLEKAFFVNNHLGEKMIALIGISFVLIISNFYNFNKERKGLCNHDIFFEYTESLNKLSNDNFYFRNSLMLTSSFLIDLSVAAIGGGWIMYAKSWRSLLSIGLFYLFRGVINAIFSMKFPNGIIWEHPGLPSFSVSYHNTTDFLFSGHVGINLLSALDTYQYGMKKLSFMAFAGIFVQIFTMIVFRGHYSIDLVAGLIAAHYFHIISYKLTHVFDYLVNIDVSKQKILLSA